MWVARFKHRRTVCQLWGPNPRPYGLAPEASALDHSAKLSMRVPELPNVCNLALWETCVACLAPSWKAGDTGIERLLKAAVDPAERSVRGLGCAGDITFR